MDSIIITINDEEEFKRCFLRAQPNITQMTDDEWIRKCFLDYGMGIYMNGKRILYKESNQPVFDKDILI